MSQTMLPRTGPGADPAAHPRTTRSLITAPRITLVGLVIIALAVRWALLDVQTGDYHSFLDPWYTHLQRYGFAGLADIDSNYNTPYLVLLTLATKVPVSELVAIKTISVIFDLLLVFFAYEIVAVVRPASAWLPTIAAGAVAVAPTVVLNSSAWAQCDAIYASLCLGSLYFLITRRAWAACVLFGLAFAFKLQAVFFAPLLVGVLVVNRMRLRALLAVPVVFVAALVPAWLAGRSWITQLMTYPAQITGGGAGVLGGGVGGGAGRPGAGAGRGFGGGGGINVAGGQHAYTDNAPTWYAWLPSDAGSVWKYVGLGLAALVVIVFAVLLLRRRRRLSAADILLLAAASTLIIPLLLPEMHERYFYLAEVLTVLAVIVGGPSWLAPALGIQVASITTYLAYLSGTDDVPLGVAALFALVGAVTAAVVMLRRLRTTADDEPALLATS